MTKLDPKALEAALPCPFCGATPHYNVGKVRTCQLHGDPIQDHVYVCPHGCARKSGPTKRRALDTWNTRTRAAALPPVDVAGLVERLRKRNENFQSLHGNYLYYGGSDSILDCESATALERLTRERDEARAAHETTTEQLHGWMRLHAEAVGEMEKAQARAEAAQARIAVLEGELAKADAIADSQYRAGAQAGFNAAQDDDPNAALARLIESRSGCVAALAQKGGDGWLPIESAPTHWRPHEPPPAREGE